MQVLLANPRGFCAGVDRAIEIVERALVVHGAPIYVRHEVVHNKFVVDGSQSQGRDVRRGPQRGAVGQHGHFQRARRIAGGAAAKRKRAGLTVFDATCPLVTKVHVEVAKMREQGREIIMIGHNGHPEVEGTMGQSRGGMYLVETPEDVARLKVGSENNLAFVTQTTLSVDDAQLTIEALKKRFPGIVGPKKDDICYATQNRQDAVKTLARQCDVVIVVGSPNSSNSNRLREVAQNQGISCLHGRQCGRTETRVAGWEKQRRRYRRRLGARGAGAAGDRETESPRVRSASRR